jgi:hypothetical protein
MPAYIHIWNPHLWPWDNLAAEARATRLGEIVRDGWSCGIRKHYDIGGRVFIYRVDNNHGVVASGYIADEPYTDTHWDLSGGSTLYVPIDFDVILDLHEILPRERLETDVPWNWRNLLGSGIEIKGDSAEVLEDLWLRHLKEIGRTAK